ncbi:MAG: permease [Eubacterium sp.]
MNVIKILKILCGIGIVYILFLQIKSLREILRTEDGKAQIKKERKFLIYNSLVALLSNFFDVLGIGDYATATAAYKLRGSVDDINIPGVLNVGNCVPVLVEAILFFSLVKIDIVTLISMLLAMVIGARVGAKFVTKWDAEKVRAGMGIGLLAVGVVMIFKQLGIGPFGMIGTATGIYGYKLVIAIVVDFFLGALMNIGVGAYAPTFALVSVLGMNVQSAFPIMMGGCAFLMTFGAGPTFLKEHRYDVTATWADTILGTVGVILAFFLVKNMPITVLLWVVVVVVFYTAVSFLRDFAKSRKSNTAE